MSKGDEVVLDLIAKDLHGNAECRSDGSIWVTRIDSDKTNYRQTFYLNRLEPQPLELFLSLPETAAPAKNKSGFRQIGRSAFAGDGRHALIALHPAEMLPQGGNSPRLQFDGDRYRLEWWDLENRQRLAVWNEGADETGGLLELKLVADGRFAVTESENTIKLWNVAKGNVEKAWTRKWVWDGLIFTPDGQHFIHYQTAVLKDNQLDPPFEDLGLGIYETDTQKLLRRLKLSDSSSLKEFLVVPLALHLQAGWLVAARIGEHVGDLNLWNVKTGELWATWKPHDGADFLANFSHDGKLLITSSHGTIRIWPLTELERGVEQLERH